jgi:UDP-GlcNAc:undecaprenyl-phosphate/decaprenyl-phosphate GlcNAc-1-phosphate transferase
MPSAELIAFGIALVACALAALPVRQLALHIGMVDRPGPRKVHLAPVPLLGCLAIYAGFVLAIFVAPSFPATPQIFGILAGATLLAAVGILDDGGFLHHQFKLFLGMPCAALVLFFVGIRADLFSALIPGRLGAALDSALTILWVVGVTAAFSILDHMDGLCAGIAAVSAVFFVLAATLTGQSLVRVLAAAALGAALVFLLWNFNPARIFMGDGGAMMLGFLMAALALKLRAFPGGPASSRLAASLVPLLILAVPIFDTTLVSISRGRRGLLPFASPGKDHTAHRLRNLGFSTRQAVLSLYAVGIISGALALLLLRLPSRFVAPVAFAVLLSVFAAVAFLERAPFDRQERS